MAHAGRDEDRHTVAAGRVTDCFNGRAPRADPDLCVGTHVGWLFGDDFVFRCFCPDLRRKTSVQSLQGGEQVEIGG